MPKPLRVCNQPGCPELTERPRCETHAREFERKRGFPAGRGYDWRWRSRIRPTFLRGYAAKDAYGRVICQRCDKSIDGQVHVDHIVPVADGGPLDDFSNLQALHHACHTQKTWGAGGDVAKRKATAR